MIMFWCGGNRGVYSTTIQSFLLQLYKSEEENKQFPSTLFLKCGRKLWIFFPTFKKWRRKFIISFYMLDLWGRKLTISFPTFLNFKISLPLKMLWGKHGIFFPLLNMWGRKCWIFFPFIKKWGWKHWIFVPAFKKWGMLNFLRTFKKWGRKFTISFPNMLDLWGRKFKVSFREGWKGGNNSSFPWSSFPIPLDFKKKIHRSLPFNT